MGLIRYTNHGNKSVGAVVIGDHPNLLDGEKIVIGNKTYEWDNNASVTGGAVAVTIGADAAEDITNLIAAINANKPSVPVTAHVDEQSTFAARIVADNPGANGNLTFTTTMADAQNTISGSGLLEGGENQHNVTTGAGRYVVSDEDVAAGSLEIETGVSEGFRSFQLSARSSTGLLKALTSLVTIGTLTKKERILLNFDGATNPVAGDFIDWIAFE